MREWMHAGIEVVGLVTRLQRCLCVDVESDESESTGPGVTLGPKVRARHEAHVCLPEEPVAAAVSATCLADIGHPDHAFEVRDQRRVAMAAFDRDRARDAIGRKEEVERIGCERKRGTPRNESGISLRECSRLRELRQPHAGRRRCPSRNRSCADEVAPPHRALPEMGVTYMAVVQSHPHLLSQPFPVGCESTDKCWIRARYSTA